MKKFIALSLLSWGILNHANAQFQMDFNNRHMSQSVLVNPGFLPQYKFTLGFRSINQLNLTGFNLNSLFNKADSASTSIRNLINQPIKTMGIDMALREELFHFGFKSKKSYFSYNTSLVLEGNINLPKDLFGFAYFGNAAYIGKPCNLDFSGTQFSAYMQNQITYGRQLTNELSVGLSAAMLNGIANIDMGNTYAKITTDTGVASIYQVGISGKIDARTSLMGINTAKILDSAYKAHMGDSINKAMSNFGAGTNRGFSFGLGAVYRINEKMRVSASVLNIGYIKWDLGAMTHSMPVSEWIFKGIDTNQMKKSGDTSFHINKAIKDTFNLKFNRSSQTVSSYTTKLHPRYILGFEYFLTRRTNIQINGGYGFGTEGNKGYLGAGIHQELGEWVDLRASYTYYNFNEPLHRIGVGMSFNLGPIQPYFNFSDVLSVSDYSTAQSFAGSLGLSINIGRLKDRDNDGVPDKRDSCRKVFGVISNNGCPYGFLGESMNNENEITADTNNVLIIVPNGDASDKQKMKPNTAPATAESNSTVTPSTPIQNTTATSSSKSDEKPTNVAPNTTKTESTTVENTSAVVLPANTDSKDTAIKETAPQQNQMVSNNPTLKSNSKSKNYEDQIKRASEIMRL